MRALLTIGDGMADDNTQRPYRSSGSSGGAPAGSDPLAELARLIGQNDPFSEFGRDGARRAAAPRAPEAAPNSLPLHEPAPDWPPHPAAAPDSTMLPLGATPPAEQPPLFGSPGFGRQQFGGDLYQVEHEVPGYGAAGVPGYPPAGGDFEQDPYQQQPEQPDDFPELGAAHDDFYDDEPPNRRRIGILAIAAVFALAVVGTAGAFGYRAIFGSSTSSGPPPVIKADTAPSKIVPTTAGKDAQASKMITDRVNARGEGEKLVSREEEPVAITPVRQVNPAAPGQGAASVLPPSGLPQLGSGIVGAEPKKIRTIAIHPEGSSAAAAPEPSAPAPAAPPPRVVTAPAPPPQRAAEPAPAPVARAAPVQTPANAPLSLNPNAAPPAARTAAVAPPTRLAPQAAAPAAASNGGYAVQVSSQRSEADAQAAFQTLQGKYPDVLGGRSSLIKRVDLGAKGIYFRAMVGPFGSSGEASELCSSLKSAGGSCLIQRN